MKNFFIYTLTVAFLFSGKAYAETAPTTAASAGVVAGEAQQKTVSTTKKKVKKTKADVPMVSVKRITEKVKGKVVSLSANSLVVLYNSDANNEYEKLISFGEEMKLAGYKKTADVKKGDIVELEYEKTIEAEGEPAERRTMMLQKIRFIKRPKEDMLVTEEKL